MALLYVTTRGIAWRKHSYSAGNDWDQSPYKYYLRRVLGWKERDNKAAFKFGRALEEAIQYYHENNGTRGVETFLAKWAAHKDDKEIKYTKTEKDWSNLNRCGQDMMRLYIIKQPSLPIPMGAHTIFQREYAKEVYPGDPNYGEIEDAGKLDIVCYVVPDHPMLPKMNWNIKEGMLRPLIVDIKTGAKDFHEAQGMAKYDMQLRRYSWLSDIRTVAFLWFKKAGTNLTKGINVTLLQDVLNSSWVNPVLLKAGSEVVVAHEADDGVWIVANNYFITEMEKAQGRKEDGKLDTTKAAVQRKMEWLAMNACRVPETSLTRCRVQFNAGIVTPEEAAMAGRTAGRQIQGIVNAWKTNTWDDSFGVRYPHDDTRDPYFQAFVLGDTAYRDLNFIKSDEQTLNDLFAEDVPEEE
jgi:hypothetical protein